MARPRSDAKRAAILEAAVGVLGEVGLSASTALIAERAAVSHGSVFKYFEAKTDLFNAAYLLLKEELGEAALSDLPTNDDPMVQLHHLWTRWLDWGTSRPYRRLALVRLGASEIVTAEARQASRAMAAKGIEVLKRSSASGVFADQSFEFVAGIFEAMAGATMDAMIEDPERAAMLGETAFEALRRALS